MTAPDPSPSAAVAAENGALILARAAALGVRVRQNPELVGFLATIEPCADVPGELWDAIAEVLAFLLRVDGERP